MSVTSPRDFLDAVTAYTSNKNVSKTPPTRPTKIGTIDPNYTSGPAKVTFDGETSLSANGYSWNASYSPVAGDRVFLIPSGSNSYIIGGKISNTPAYNAQLNITLAPGFSNFGSPWHTPTLTVSSAGVVKLSGLIKGGGGNYSQLIGDIPSQFAPDVSLFFGCLANGSTNVIQIAPDGAVWTMSDPATANYISLDNCVYSIDPSLYWNQTYPYSGTWKSDGRQGSLSSYVKDTVGRVWMRGGITDGVTPTPHTYGADNTIFTLPSGYRPQYTQHQQSANVNYAPPGFAFISPLSSGALNWKYLSYATDGMTIANAVFHTAATGWNNVSYLNGWTSFDTTSYAPLSYRKDSDGMVYLRGLIKSGTMAAAAGTLPVGCRPNGNLLYATPSNAAQGRLDIYSDGSIVPASGSNAWFSCDGIMFSAEQ